MGKIVYGGFDYPHTVALIGLPCLTLSLFMQPPACRTANTGLQNSQSHNGDHQIRSGTPCTAFNYKTIRCRFCARPVRSNQLCGVCCYGMIVLYMTTLLYYLHIKSCKRVTTLLKVQFKLYCCAVRNRIKVNVGCLQQNMLIKAVCGMWPLTLTSLRCTPFTVINVYWSATPIFSFTSWDICHTKIASY